MNKNAIKYVAIGGAIAIALVLATLLSFRIAYWNRILPGVKVGSVNLGGLSRAEAQVAISNQTSKTNSQSLTINTSSGSIVISKSDLVESYQPEVAAQTAYNVGHSGMPWSQLLGIARTLTGGQKPLTVPVVLQPTALATLTSQVATNTNTAVKNASFSSDNGSFVILPEQSGERLAQAKFVSNIKNQLGSFGSTVQPTTYQLQPPLTATSIGAHREFFERIAKNPLVITTPNQNWQLGSDTLLSWLTIDTNIKPTIKDSFKGYYNVPAQINGPEFNPIAIYDYVNSLSGDINQDPVDAKLSFNGTSVVATRPSKFGQSLDAASSTTAIITALQTNQSTPVALVVQVKNPEISEANLASLGINELISEGVSYFPHSTAERMQNVRVGSSKFQNAVVKPNSVFSFGDIMGNVGPAQGYAPSKVILGDHQEFQYGGGMCQVSSTAFRAALNAGFPIVQRTNHAFQVSYYTQPYGVPGVDATIYAPEVDFKFRNDTPHYILIQTEMVGTTLKFRYYSTKTKTGVIRGPFFVSGSLDPNTPSQTVFYRDVMVNGQVAKTDTFNTYYKSALEFPTSN